MMKYLLITLISLAGFCAVAQTNQHALTTAGGHQGQIGGYYFEFSVGQPFTQTGQGAGFWNTTGILQPVASEAALPVTLISFAVQKSEGSSALLTWITTQEENSESFQAQHSLNGKSWEAIGSVKAAGETNHTVTHYSFVDLNPASGENLYRLKMIDLDGTFAYSNIRSIRFENQMITKVYPNPVTDHLQIETDKWEDVHSVALVDLAGRQIYQSSEKPSKQIEVSILPAGLYVLNLQRKNGEVTTRKVLVKR